MKEYIDYYKTVASHPTTSGQGPNVAGYFWVKFADNLLFYILLFVLVAFTIFFAWYGLSTSSGTDERAKWALNAASLCLGVFLGLFAGKSIK